METKNVSILRFCTEDNITDNLLIVDDVDVFGTEEYGETVRKILHNVFDMDNCDNSELIEDFERTVKHVTNGFASKWLDYEVFYEPCDMVYTSINK